MQLISKAFCQPAVEGEGREKPLVKNIFNIQGGLFYRRKKKKKKRLALVFCIQKA